MKDFPLEVGSFGDDVKDLHRKLISHGFRIRSSEVDRGFFGPATRDAVIEWQRNHGLPATGGVEKRTSATLETGFAPAGPLPESPATSRADFLPPRSIF